ncbi:pyoverdine-tailoring dipeptidase-like protein PvdM [soil metagenome]
MSKFVSLAALGAALLVGPGLASAAPDAAAIHARALVLDSHADIPLDLGTPTNDPAKDTAGQVDLPKLERGQVDAVVLAVFVPQGPRTLEGYAKARADADTKLAAIRAIPERNPDRAVLALSADDVEAAAKAGKRAIIFGFLNAYPFGKETDAIDTYYKAGVRSFGFTHAGNNDYADSSRPSGEPKVEWGGLSPVGKAAVAKLNRLGVIIDVSQLTPDGVFQTLALSKAPVVASHSGVKGLVDSPRNLSDAELDAIAAKGGVVQIVAFNAYLIKPGPDYPAKAAALRVQYGLPAAYAKPADGIDSLSPEQRTKFVHELSALLPRASVKELADSIDYAVKRIGVDHVGIGSDFNHGGGVTGWANEGEAENVTAELVRRGYSEADIDKIWGGNWLRVFRQVETTARQLR